MKGKESLAERNSCYETWLKLSRLCSREDSERSDWLRIEERQIMMCGWGEGAYRGCEGDKSLPIIGSY